MDSKEEAAEMVDRMEGLKAGDTSKSVEELMQKWTTSNMAKAAPMPKKALKQEVEDCLDEAGKEKKAHPEYQSRTPLKTIPGYSFGTSSGENDKQFYNNDLSAYMFLGKESPGPCYTPMSFTDHPSKAQTIPKAQRIKDEKTKKSETTPGPYYDIPGSLGRQLARASAPTCKMGQSSRFTDSEYISKAHSKTMMNAESPAPNTYSPEDAEKGPAYSFSARTPGGAKLFLSKAHAERDGTGTNSPGPMYNWKTELTKSKGPAFSFGMSDRPVDSHPPRSQSVPIDGTAASAEEEKSTGKRKKGHDRPRFISREHAKLEPGKDSPGPGRYTPNPVGSKEGSAYTFGHLDSSTNRYISRDLVQYGQESPGPQYNPNEKHTMKNVPGAVFADKDPAVAQLGSRFAEKQFLGNQLASNGLTGSCSPGPAAYDPVNVHENEAPAYSMARREKVLVKRICPGPERARFLSKELAKENLGAYSPGPKYKVPDHLGDQSSVKYTFGTSDREFEDIAIELKDKMGTIEKPYTAPWEARFYSPEMQKVSMLGKYSPGPKYNPSQDLVMKRTPAHAMSGKWKSKETPKATKQQVDEERRKLKAKGPQKDVTAPNAPITRFGNSKRGLLPGEESKGRQYAGKDSPGPVYRPNFESVSKKSPAPSLGGLH
jgi:hypothetical protein|eukprot:CAMPEP_0174322782 /NCGR_PEP_ID=MMETSP0810-20121108/11268_1 /TAXON_ID=73025 ORGANISM="Eutreptiella gymnastica-like, Strain CCMP1594" /NCGR_SAMPLE_ID=MMETSP0810 /ASSEMBLY_ACC=CAM_ASM_000659 /LENGTH=655 /DNA_ID=CAMNT_0015434787 /DNA_START=84 /DNA_END=2051 /DNA_ORIENTATION=-